MVSTAIPPFDKSYGSEKEPSIRGQAARNILAIKADYLVYAVRGELVVILAVGYLRVSENLIDMVVERLADILGLDSIKVVLNILILLKPVDDVPAVVGLYKPASFLPPQARTQLPQGLYHLAVGEQVSRLVVRHSGSSPTV